MRRYSREDFERVFENMLGDPLPGATPQPITEVSAVQRHTIGARMVIGDRTFHYAHVLAAVEACIQGWGAVNRNDIQERAGASWDVNGVIGDRVAVINAMVNDITLNQFAGGYLLYADADTGDGNQIPIISHNAATVGNPVTLQLGHPLTGSATAGVTGATLVGSIFGNIRLANTAGGQGFSTVVGVPLINIPTNNFGWLITWGPCLCVATANTGVNLNERIMYFNTDGSIFMPSGLSTNHQMAGVLLPLNYYGGVGNSTNYIILMLHP